jgi:hypothetical protein
MNYTELFTAHHIAVLVDWLEEKGEVCVEIHIPHGGGSASYYTVRSLNELKRIVTVNSREIVITIWKTRAQAEFESDEGVPVADDLKWMYFHPDEVMYFAVLKNRNWSESYDKNPARYRKDIDEWLS